MPGLNKQAKTSK